MSEPHLTEAFRPASRRGGKAIELAMQRLWVVGRILPVGARLLVKHTFRSGENKPLEVVYSFGLPRDAALRRFRITGEGFSVSSTLKPVEEAREAYEKGLEDGRLAAVAQQYGDGVVNLAVGNIRPGEEVTVLLEILAGVETRDDGIRFRFPFTLAPTYHARAKAAEVRPNVGEIELPDDEFGDVILPQFVADSSGLHSVGFDLSVDMPDSIIEVSSPSHPVRIVNRGSGRSRISLATAEDLPNRDLVLDVRTDMTQAGVIGAMGGDGKGHFSVVVPSSFFMKESGKSKMEPRRIVFLLDRSGSMRGIPIDQARKAIEACLGVLEERDYFGLVAFDDKIELLSRGLLPASKANRDKARAFLAGIAARGGTELAAGFEAAAKIFEGSQNERARADVFVVTDGQVSGTERIIAAARAAEIRIHCLGIGSASEDRFLNLLSRETDGRSRFLTPRERVDLGAVDLFASVGRPVAKGLAATVEGFSDASIAPDPPAYVYAGTPVVLFGTTSGQGLGSLVLEWDAEAGSESSRIPIGIGGGEEGEAIRLFQGARLITELEAKLPCEMGTRGEDRDHDRIIRRLKSLSEVYGLASRPMALVAVVERAGDRPGDLPITRVVPVGLAQDVEFQGYFDNRSLQAVYCRSLLNSRSEIIYEHRNMSYEALIRPLAKSLRDVDDSQGSLLKLASTIEPDGGMPGKTEEERVLSTILAVLQFLAGGHSATRGAFRLHVKRLVESLERSILQNHIVKEIINRGRSGRSLEGDWSKNQPSSELWEVLEKALHAAVRTCK